MARTKRMKIDLATEVQKAFDFIWADHLKVRAAGHDYDGQTYYTTATDLENRVRAALAEKAEGLDYGHYGTRYDSYRSPYRISTGTRQSLFSYCRSWLLNQAHKGVLDSHNHGRGHVSGERFRPKGEPLSPQEQRSKAKREKEGPRGENKLVHARDPEVRAYAPKTLCSRAARKSAKPRWGGRSSHRTETRFSYEGTANYPGQPVTCPRCLKLLAEAEKAKAEFYQNFPAWTIDLNPVTV